VLRPLLKTCMARVPPLRRLLAQRDEARREVAVLEQRLAAREARRDLGFVFVVAYGRSGSTLVQGLLSSIPGYLVRGENGDACYSLYRFHRGLEEARATQTKKRPLRARDPWFGIDGYPREEALTRIRELILSTVLRPRAGTRVVGFKEIRWWHEDWRDYLAFLREVFPGARFVINTRNHRDVSASKWWADNEDAPAMLDRLDTMLDEMAEELAQDCYRVRYDEFVEDPGVLRGLFDWLGEPFDLAAVREVMDRKHSY